MNRGNRGIFVEAPWQDFFREAFLQKHQSWRQLMSKCPGVAMDVGLVIEKIFFCISLRWWKIFLSPNQFWCIIYLLVLTVRNTCNDNGQTYPPVKQLFWISNLLNLIESWRYLRKMKIQLLQTSKKHCFSFENILKFQFNKNAFRILNSLLTSAFPTDQRKLPRGC